MSDLFKTVETQASYGIGFQMGQQLQSNPFDGLDLDSVVAGLQDAFTGQAPQVDNDALRAAFGEIHERMQAAKAEQHKAAIEEGEQFLAENAKRDEVQVTESGLQYEVVSAGDGEVPTAESTIRAHYHGTLIDGSVFDSSVDRGKPIVFGLNEVIAGWTEGLQLMKVGGKARLVIPSALAYGDRPPSPKIPPGATLVFEVELLGIE